MKIRPYFQRSHRSLAHAFVTIPAHLQSSGAALKTKSALLESGARRRGHEKRSRMPTVGCRHVRFRTPRVARYGRDLGEARPAPKRPIEAPFFQLGPVGRRETWTVVLTLPTRRSTRATNVYPPPQSWRAHSLRKQRAFFPASNSEEVRSLVRLAWRSMAGAVRPAQHLVRCF